ncbi:MAG: hypothetical protein HKK67_09115 [Chlorobiaceae bacterium]|nr:hypothetical protein [Chlorobiaceae bacterium]
MSLVLFQMSGSFRALLIRSHKFYVEQAQKRLLSQFQNIEEEAEKYSREWLNQHSPMFDPDRYNADDFYDQATEEGIEYYEMLEDMRNRTRLSVISGMYHEWDKQFRGWLTKEIEFWHHGNEAKSVIWKKTFYPLMDFLEAIGFHVKSMPYFTSLDRCRLIVNAYKHGDGDAFTHIKKLYPEFINESMNDSLYIDMSDHTDLVVSDAHVEEFSKAIIDFWESVPENFFDSDIICFPEWFEKAFEKDLTNSKKQRPEEP